jgi:hypothetical protein
MLATNFGSINRSFEYNGESVVVPDGTAHFLEHKLFEGKEGNAFDYYAKTGAKANAFTSNDKTAYYFNCSDNFEQNLKVLLTFVSNPYLTDENVEKEVFLVLSAATKYKDLLNINQVFSSLKNYSIIFTKLDETTCLGNILNMKLHTGLQLSYVTSGQAVPDDISIIDAQKIARNLLGSAE